MSRASFLACFRRDSSDGRAGRDCGAVIATSFHDIACIPLNARLKEGADAHDSDQNRWEYSLAAGWWRPVSALPAVSSDTAAMSTAEWCGSKERLVNLLTRRPGSASSSGRG